MNEIKFSSDCFGSAVNKHVIRQVICWISLVLKHSWFALQLLTRFTYFASLHIWKFKKMQADNPPKYTFTCVENTYTWSVQTRYYSNCKQLHGDQVYGKLILNFL